MDKKSAAISTNDLKSIWRRRKVPMMIMCVVFLGACIILAMALPAIYESTATIFVQKPEIPEELLSSNDDEYIQYEIDSIKQKVLTPENLLKIGRETGFIIGRPISSELSSITKPMIEAISTKYITNERITDRGHVVIDTLAFTISVQDTSPDRSSRIASELGKLFIAEASSRRQEKAASASRFLRKEVDRLGREVANYESKLSNLKQQNIGLLPESTDYTLRLLDSTRRTLTEQQAEAKELRSRKQDLEYQLSSEGNAQTELAIARAELLQAQQKYSEFHPDIARLKGKIRALEESGSYSDTFSGAAGNGPSAVATIDPNATQLRSELRQVNSQLEAVLSNLRSTEEKVAGFEQRLQKSPDVERKYLALQRDYENSLAKLDDLKKRLLEAQLTEQLELEQQATRFELFLPESEGEQIKPNRAGIILLGTVFSLLVTILVGTLLEQLDTTIRGKSDVVDIMHEEPIAIIPDLESASKAKIHAVPFPRAASLAGIILLLAAGSELIFQFQI